jgi:hypothetical protein
MYQPYRPPGAPPSSPIEPIPSAPPASGATPRSQPPGPTPPTPTRADIGRDIQDTMKRINEPAPPTSAVAEQEAIRKAMEALFKKPPGAP